jgi:predicted enzyme related to lactoylglutathione lyase
MTQPPEDYEYGKFAWVMDPDGRKVELWQPIEPKP